jgi:Kdo2-lipid IVA lauroyltransferase/acyltransferase
MELSVSSKKIVKRFLYRLEFIALITFSVIFQTLPASALYGFAKGLGIIAFSWIRVRRRVTMENLRESYGEEKSEQELIQIARAAYINIATTFAEMLLFPKLHGKVLDMVDLEEVRVVHEAISHGRGVMLISGHFGSWEMNGASMTTSGIPVVIVAKKQANPLVDTWITRYRKELNMSIISPGAPVKHLVRALRNGEVVGLISDQDAGRKGVFVPFFGRLASTTRGAAELALRYNTPLVACMTIRLSPGKYKTLVRNVEVLSDDTVESLTARYTKVMEDIIRLYPEQYFWMHRRWKTRPGNIGDTVDEVGEKEESVRNEEMS